MTLKKERDVWAFHIASDGTAITNHNAHRRGREMGQVKECGKSRLNKIVCTAAVDENYHLMVSYRAIDAECFWHRHA